MWCTCSWNCPLSPQQVHLSSNIHMHMSLRKDSYGDRKESQSDKRGQPAAEGLRRTQSLL
ncbi:hypothetical protein EYF80_022111 [Liparis tanakae]|uniref:Uncharacterized protein n=1 Tax=Liparis tanakae TaxID=230148 RepID=A0A4Z2HPE4_9TELE|nr:hypothetical protein EYF80_022111 [Liparis tanakae]